MKSIFLLLCMIIATSCSYNSLETNKLELQIKVPIEIKNNNKYNILLRRELENLIYNDPKSKLLLKSEIKFSSKGTLSLSGLSPLNLIEGIVYFRLITRKSNTISNHG